MRPRGVAFVGILQHRKQPWTVTCFGSFLSHQLSAPFLHINRSKVIVTLPHCVMVRNGWEGVWESIPYITEGYKDINYKWDHDTYICYKQRGRQTTGLDLKFTHYYPEVQNPILQIKCFPITELTSSCPEVSIPTWWPNQENETKTSSWFIWYNSGSSENSHWGVHF